MRETGALVTEPELLLKTATKFVASAAIVGSMVNVEATDSPWESDWEKRPPLGTGESDVPDSDDFEEKNHFAVV